MRERRRLTMTVLFLILICVPLLVHIAGNPPLMPFSENRTKAASPGIPQSLAGIQSFPMLYDTYLHDNFGLRNTLISINSWMKWRLHMQFMPFIIRGQSDWLFLGDHIDKTMTQCLGMYTLNEKDMALWIKGVAKIKRWIENRGMKFFLSIMPNKCRVYEELIPRAFRKRLGPTPLEQIKEYLNKESLDIGLVDPIKPMMNAKGKDDIYYKLDEHWNNIGAYASYKHLMSLIKPSYPEMSVLEEDDFNVLYHSYGMSGQATLISLSKYLHEYAPVLELKHPSHVTFNAKSDILWDSAPSWVYNVTNNTEAPKLLSYYDSALTEMFTPLRETFYKSIFLQRYLNRFDARVVETLKPDVVLVSMAERLVAMHILYKAPLFCYDIKSCERETGIDELIDLDAMH